MNMHCSWVKSVLLSFIALSAYGVQADMDVPSDRSVKVKERFEILLERVSQENVSAASWPRQVVSETPAFQEMISLGPSCLPYLMESRRQTGLEFNLLVVAAEILKLPPESVSGETVAVFRKSLESKMRNGYKEAEEKLPILMGKWSEAKRETDVPALWHDVTVLDPEFRILRTERQLTPLGEVYTEIQNLGIFVLPLLMREVKKGEYDFLPIIGFLTNGSAPLDGWGRADEAANACLQWWEEHRSEWIVDVPAGKSPPDDKAHKE